MTFFLSDLTGLPLSLPVGIKFAKRLCTEFGKPLIPVHQLEAHVLSSRMLQDQTFPYAVLLISATNCVIGIVHGINKFQVLGTTLDDAPGDVLNRVNSGKLENMKLRKR